MEQNSGFYVSYKLCKLDMLKHVIVNQILCKYWFTKVTYVLLIIDFNLRSILHDIKSMTRSKTLNKQMFTLNIIQILFKPHSYKIESINLLNIK